MCEVAEKLDRKQLKQPDEFQVLANKAMQWTAQHTKQVTMAIAALPFLVGLCVAIPVLGHATWHLYRKAVL